MPPVCSVSAVADSTSDEHARFRRLDDAFRVGDLPALRAELDSIDGFPNVIAHAAIGACLTYAIYHSPLDLIDQLLELGADPNWPSDDGFPPLIAALSSADVTPGAVARDDALAIVETLLAHGAAVDQRGINDYTPLHWAAGQGDLTMVELLLANGADPNEITRIDDLETALEVAAAAGHERVVQRLAPLTVRLDWEEASRVGDIGSLSRLIHTGHDINSTDGYGQTALMRASHAGQIKAVAWLIEHGADLDHTSKFHLSALMLAVVAGHHAIARTLVTAGADTTITGTGVPGFHGKTAGDLARDRGDRRLAAFIARGSSD